MKNLLVALTIAQALATCGTTVFAQTVAPPTFLPGSGTSFFPGLGENVSILAWGLPDDAIVTLNGNGKTDNITGDNITGMFDPVVFPGFAPAANSLSLPKKLSLKAGTDIFRSGEVLVTVRGKSGDVLAEARYWIYISVPDQMSSGSPLNPPKLACGAPHLPVSVTSEARFQAISGDMTQQFAWITTDGSANLRLAVPILALRPDQLANRTSAVDVNFATPGAKKVYVSDGRNTAVWSVDVLQ